MKRIIVVIYDFLSKDSGNNLSALAQLFLGAVLFVIAIALWFGVMLSPLFLIKYIPDVILMPFELIWLLIWFGIGISTLVGIDLKNVMEGFRKCSENKN